MRALPAALLARCQPCPPAHCRSAGLHSTSKACQHKSKSLNFELHSYYHTYSQHVFAPCPHHPLRSFPVTSIHEVASIIDPTTAAHCPCASNGTKA